ncbi:unnamed protein product [Lathyrus sativus]|nr:unnamed protein product [Lathyrus sativus]
MDTDVGVGLQNESIPSNSVDQSFSVVPPTSAKSDCSPLTCSSNTPAKRVVVPTTLDDILQDKVLTPRQSATKVKHIKKE